MFESILQYPFIVSIFSLAVVVINFGINHLDTTSLENKLMTNFKKLQTKGALIILEIFIITIFLTAIVWVINGTPDNIIDDKGQISLNNAGLFVFSIAFISLCFSLILHFSIYVAKKICVIKHNFYVHLPDSDEKWYLVRKSSQNRILLKSTKEEYIFIDEWSNLVFKTEFASLNILQQFIYTSEKRLNKVVFTLLIFIIVLYISYVGLSIKDNTFWSLLILMSIIPIFTVFYWLEKIKKLLFNQG